jgi:RNA polymerase sigma factor (sigma-70 family)
VDLDDLIKACQNCDRNAQEQLYKLLSSKLFGVCLKYSPNSVEAEDNLQEGFLLILEKINQFQFKGSFEGWAKRVVINYILQQYRKNKYLEVVTEQFPEQEEIIIDEDTTSMELLLQLVQELPDRYRLVFTLYVLDDYSHKEIADMLGINEGTSKSNLSRARMILKNRLEQSISDRKFMKL